MKKLILATAILLLISCKKEASKESFAMSTEIESATAIATPALNNLEVLGKEIFEGKGNCFACHQVDQKVIGPSLQEIAKIYKAKNGDMVNFFKGNGEAIVDPTQYDVMKANLEITKTFSDEELKGLEAYIYSNL